MIVFGGYDSNNFLNDTWEYNIDTDTWTQKSSGATARYEFPIIVYNDGTNNKMIIHGGYGPSDTVLDDLWEYNITTDTWTQLSSGPSARYDHTITYYNNGSGNKMLLFGGYDKSNALNELWEYDIDDGSWTQKTSCDSSRLLHIAFIYNNNGHYKLIILCGHDGNNALDDVWEYDIKDDLWKQDVRCSTPRYAFRGIIYNDGFENRIMLFGGNDGNNTLDSMWTYNAESGSKLYNSKLLIPIK